MAGPTERDFEQLRDRLENSISSLRGTLDSLNDAQRVATAQNAEAEEKRAKAARSGELGSDWQRIQQRIDLNSTTLADVFSGRDDSPEARALLGTARSTLAEVSKELDDEAEAAEEETPQEEVQRMNATFQARLAEFQRFTNGEGLA